MTRSLLRSSGESSASPSSPLSCSKTSSSAKSIPPLNTSSGLALGLTLLLPEKKDNGAATAPDIKVEALSTSERGFGIGIADRTYAFLLQALDVVRG